MKNTIRFLGIIAMVAVIGFSMAACGDNGDLIIGNWTGTVGSDAATLDIDQYQWELKIGAGDNSGTNHFQGYHGEPDPAGHLFLHGGTKYGTASVSGSTLTLTIDGGGTGTFTKK